MNNDKEKYTHQGVSEDTDPATGDNNTQPEDTDIEREMSDEEQYGDETDTADSAALVKNIKQKLQHCRAERQDYMRGWQRAAADLINARKNFDAERERIVSFAEENLLLELIPCIDNFEMAFANKDAWEAVGENWRHGVEYIYQQLLKVLQDHGVTQIHPIGAHFDPKDHTAVATVATDTPEDDQKIVAVAQRGYIFQGHTIRPARVTTAVYSKDAQPLSES